METLSATDILFHPSSLGKIMTGVKKGWSVDESLTCKRELIKIYRQLKYDRYYSHTNKYVEKGIKMEEDAITLYSKFKNVFLKKNDTRFTNDYFTGEPDIISNDFTVDTKCSWSLETLPHILTDKVDEDYEYQGFGYMHLLNKKQHIVVYCLVNAPLNLIVKEKESLYYKMDCPTEENEKYLSEKIAIEKNMIFDLKQFMADNPNYDLDSEEWNHDIPISERIVEYTVNYNEEKMQAIKKRIDDCRLWITNNLIK